MKRLFWIVSLFVLLSSCAPQAKEPSPWYWKPPPSVLDLVARAYPAQPGLIEGFTSSHNETTVSVDGNLCYIHNQNGDGTKPYAVTIRDNNMTARFEVREHDVWVDPAGGGDEDANPELNRSEFHCYGRQYAAGVDVIASWNVRFLSALSSTWNVLGQNHDSSGSPPIAVQGDTRNLYAVWRNPNFNSLQLLSNFELNRWYAIRIETNNANNSSGYVRFYLDNALVMDYSGPVGDGEFTWFNWGIYREGASLTSIVEYNGMLFRLAAEYPGPVAPPDSEQPTPTPSATAVNTLTPVPAMTSTALAGLAWEAEQGAIDSPFVTSSGFVSQNVLTISPLQGGRAAYRFMVADSGEYVIRMTLNAPDTGSNSVFVGVDQEPDTQMIWDIEPGQGERFVAWRESSPSETYKAARPFFLNSGEHILIVRGRESGVLLDKIALLRNDLQTPTPTASMTPSRTATASRTPTLTPTNVPPSQTPSVTPRPPTVTSTTTQTLTPAPDWYCTLMPEQINCFKK